MEREALQREAATKIRAHLGPEYRLVLFGSWARGDAHKNSDLDIGILGPRALEHQVYAALVGELETLPSLRRIDVVDLQTVSERFRDKAVREGVPL